MERGELPTKDDVEARVNERMTVTLESRYRDKTNLNRERLRRFLPMVLDLAREEPELLAMLVDDLYHDTLHGAPDTPVAAPDVDVAVPEAGGKESDEGERARTKKRKKRRRPGDRPGPESSTD